MQLKDIMTRDPACCAPGTKVQEIAMKSDAETTIELVEKVSEPGRG